MSTTTYHKATPTEAPWLLALRRLHGRGWCDREIADALQDLSAEAISWLERKGRWQETDKMLVPLSGGAWTRRQVRYWRHRLQLPERQPRTTRDASLGIAKYASFQSQAGRAGWGHLLPLTPSEVKLLGALELGPATRAGLEARTGLQLDRDRRGQRTPLRCLLDRQIVVMTSLRPLPQYALAAGSQRRVRGDGRSAIERLARRLSTA